MKQNEVFLVTLGDFQVAAVPLKRSMIREIAGSAAGSPPPAPSIGASGKYVSQSDTIWLVVTNAENPMLKNFGDLAVIAANKIGEKTGSSVRKEDVVVSPVYVHSVDNGRGEDKIVAIERYCDNCGSPLVSRNGGRTWICPKCG